MIRQSLLASAMLLSSSVAAMAQFPPTPPAPAKLTPAPFPPFQEAVLPNGLRILVVENHNQPVVSVQLAFMAGSAVEPDGKEGLASMVAGLLTKGAGTRSADQIAGAIEGAGGSLTASTTNDFLIVSSTVLSPALPLAFELLGDVVMRPTFPDTEIELLRKQTLSGLEVERSRPDAIAQRTLRRVLYGQSPYARSPSPASVKALAKTDLVAFHRDRLRPGGALLVLAGDVTLAQARRLTLDAFRGWLGSPPAATAAKAPPVRTAPELVLVHRPTSVQSSILVGNLASQPADPRNYALAVANRILGGASDSRLFQILREQKSWTYGANSAISRRRAFNTFVASTDVRTDVTDSALTEMLHQLRRIGSEPVPSEDLENARSAMVGSYPLSIETAAQVADAVATARLFGLAPDYVQTYRVKLGAVTAAEVEAAAQAFIRPDIMTIVVVGDATKVYERLKGIAPTTIVDVDGKPLAPADLVPKAAALPIDPAALQPTQDSLAIMLQGNQLGAVTGRLERTADGFTYVEATNLAGMVQQRTEVHTDASFKALSVTQTGKLQGQETKIDVTFAAGRAKGAATTPDQKTGALKTVTIDTTVSPAAIEENLIQPALAGLPWKDGASWTFPVFSTSSGEMKQSTLKVLSRETVTVPAGTVECYKVELTGGPQTAHFWLSAVAPYRLMKLAIVGTPIEMVRIR